MSFMMESTVFTSMVVAALVAALGLLLILFLLNTTYLGVKAANTPYPVPHFFSEALFPAFKILLLQLLAFLAVVYLIGFLSIPLSCLSGFIVVAVMQIYFGQKQMHYFAGEGPNIWSTKLFGIPSAIATLILCIPTACFLFFVVYWLIQGHPYLNASPFIPSVEAGLRHHR